MTTGHVILLGLLALTLGSLLLVLPGLVAELKARRTLARVPGTVEDVQFNKAGRLTGARATISFKDASGQVRRFTTPWAEDVYSKGDAVTVGYRTSGKGEPRVISLGGLLEHVLRVGIAAALTLALLAVLARAWFGVATPAP